MMPRQKYYRLFFYLNNKLYINSKPIGVLILKFDNYIFDFDGTLADTKKCGEVATQSAFKAWLANESSSKEITHYMGIPIEESFLKLADRPLDEAALAKLIDTFNIHINLLKRTRLINPRV